MSNKYDFGGSSTTSNNSDNSGYAPTFKIAPFIKLRGVISRLFVGNSDFGQSIAVTYDDGHLVDGILTKRTDKEQYKVFSWKDAPVIEDETLDCDDLPPILTKTYGGDNYKYEILAARLQEDEEVGYGNDVEVRATDDDYEGTGPIPTNILLEDDDGNPDGRFTVYETAGEDGPNSCGKTTAKVLSSLSHGAVVDEDSQFSWLADNIELRAELQGMEVQYAKVQRESNESEHSFYFPIFMDAATDTMILPDNEVESSGGESVPEAAQDDPMDKPDETPTDDSDPVQEFYETCDELSIDTEPAVLGLLEDMVEDDDNELTADMVDEDEVVADLVA